MLSNTAFSLCVVAVVIATTRAAPVSSDEKLTNEAQASNYASRDKRADELVFYGNQQNQGQAMAKKSDPGLSELIEQATPEVGNVDEGAQVAVNDATPVEEDLDARAEAAQDSQSIEDNTAQAVESAMHSAFSNEEPEEAINEKDVNESEEEEGAGDTNEETGGSVDDDEEEEEENEGVTEEDDLNQAATLGDEAESEEVSNSDENTTEMSDDSTGDSGSDDTSDESSSSAGSNENDIPATAVEDAAADDTGNGAGDDDEVEQFLQSLGNQDQEKTDTANSPAKNDLELQLLRDYYKYVEPRENIFQFPGRYRRRRRSSKLRAGSPSIVARRARRIKRDLYDEDDDDVDDSSSYYGPLQWYNDDSREPAVDYPSSTDDASKYFYTRLYEYLNDPYTSDEKYYVDNEDLDSDDADPGDWLSQQEYVPNERQYYLSYEPEDSDDSLEMSYPEEEDDSSVPYSQRDRRKRYFFPFEEEPEAHWGAFVPSKRSYAGALERLQWLAMALSDNPNSYQRQMLEDYRRK